MMEERTYKLRVDRELIGGGRGFIGGRGDPITGRVLKQYKSNHKYPI